MVEERSTQVRYGWSFARARNWLEDGGNEGLLGRALMLYTHSFFLYSFSAQSPCILAFLFFTNICLCQMCVCIGTKVKNVALLFLRVPAKLVEG